MERLSRVQGRIESLQDLGEVVGGIRSISAARSQQAQRSLAGARRHAEIVEDALGAALALLPKASRREARGQDREGIVVLFASEHGFVGAFNELLAEAVAERLVQRPARVFVAGSRGAQVASEQGLSLEWTTPLTTHPEGVLAVGRRIAAELYARSPGGISTVDVLFMRSERAGRHRLEWLRLLPFDPSGFARGPGELPPLRNLAVPALVERLVEEYVLAELVRAATESFASEHGARLLAMATAYDSVETKLSDLTRLAAQLRQEEITTELLDIVTGAEALRGER